VPTLNNMPSSNLAERPGPAFAASLPRKVNLFAGAARDEEDDNEESNDGAFTRGAIDIVKGLEQKRQRRREKLYQKHCRKAGKQQEKKPQPGKGAERMRELGMELAGKRGKNDTVYMLSL